MKRELLAAAIITAMLTTGAHADDKADAKQAREKCYGVAKAEKNDCSAKDGSNACAGHAKKDRDDNSWGMYPKVCAINWRAGLKDNE